MVEQFHLTSSSSSLFSLFRGRFRYLSRERRLLEIQKRSILPKTEQATMSTLSPHSATVSPSAMAIHQSSSSDPIAPASGGGGGGGGGRRMSRFEVTPVDSSQITFSLDPAISEPSSPTDPRSIPLKSILKHSTVSYPGHITTTSSYGELKTFALGRGHKLKDHKGSSVSSKVHCFIHIHTFAIQ